MARRPPLIETLSTGSQRPSVAALDFLVAKLRSDEALTVKDRNDCALALDYLVFKQVMVDTASRPGRRPEPGIRYVVGFARLLVARYHCTVKDAVFAVLKEFYPDQLHYADAVRRSYRRLKAEKLPMAFPDDAVTRTAKRLPYRLPKGN